MANLVIMLAMYIGSLNGWPGTWNCHPHTSAYVCVIDTPTHGLAWIIGSYADHRITFNSDMIGSNPVILSDVRLSRNHNMCK